MTERERLQRRAEELEDEGRLIEAGWIGLLIQALPNTTNQGMLAALRVAYLSGARHLYEMINEKGCILGDGSFVDRKQEPDHINKIEAELKAFDAEMNAALARGGLL